MQDDRPTRIKSVQPLSAGEKLVLSFYDFLMFCPDFFKIAFLELIETLTQILFFRNHKCFGEIADLGYFPVSMTQRRQIA